MHSVYKLPYLSNPSIEHEIYRNEHDIDSERYQRCEFDLGEKSQPHPIKSLPPLMIDVGATHALLKPNHTTTSHTSSLDLTCRILWILFRAPVVYFHLPPYAAPSKCVLARCS
ncbi:unnamed protein product [Periconia digitata]|uniref:Uncharacterized protein n=1 Tax=Periconia digitata TaxID=1303443 RepID=A0A9W4UKY5_9PLEO|nr:unnamed protein product [Periconia digitata]